MDTCHCCSWKMKIATTWVLRWQVNEVGLFPSLPKSMRIVQAVLDIFVDKISRKLLKVVTLYLHDRKNFSSAVNPSLAGLWEIKSSPIWRCPVAFLGCVSTWRGMDQGSFPKPQLFMPETTDSFSIRPISWNFWGPGKHTTFPTPTTGGLGWIDLVPCVWITLHSSGSILWAPVPPETKVLI